MNKKKWSSFRKEIVNNNLNGIGQILCYIRGHSENVKTPMFSYDFIIVREILPEKGYLSILKGYVVVKSMSKFRLFILENHFRNYLQYQTLYLY